MRTLFAAALVACLLAPAAAPAQVEVQVQIALPARPPLVVVQPGIQVVEDWDEEVFYTRGVYWLRRGPAWYRAPGPRAAFVYVAPERIPPGLARLPPGQYRHFRKEQAKAERKAWKAREKAERKAAKEERRRGKREEHHDHD
jgi:hypothetical protein